MNPRLLRTIDVVASVLVIIGALNWGLIGFFEFNLVAAIFGDMTVISRIIYALVGLAGVYEIIAMPSMPKRWIAPAPSEAIREREREREHMHV